MRLENWHAPPGPSFPVLIYRDVDGEGVAAWR